MEIVSTVILLTGEVVTTTLQCNRLNCDVASRLLYIDAPILNTIPYRNVVQVGKDRRINNCRIHLVPPADADLWSSRLGGNLALPNLRQ